jgi:hypothetical protein
VEITCRYCFPTGGASGPLWVAGAYIGAFMYMTAPVPFPGESAMPAGNSASRYGTAPASTGPPPVKGTINRYTPPPFEHRQDDSETPGKRAGAGQGTSQVYFDGKKGLTIQWEVLAEGHFDSEKLVAPARQNFAQGAWYRLKLTDEQDTRHRELLATMEIQNREPRTEAFLQKRAIPVNFDDDEIDRAFDGNPITKVVYLPHEESSESPRVGIETLVNSRPIVDPIAEAKRRGAVIAIIRLGRPGAFARDQSFAPTETKPRAADWAEVFDLRFNVETAFERRQGEPSGAHEHRPEGPIWGPESDGSIPILGPYQKGAKDEAIEAPSEEEVIQTWTKRKGIEPPEYIKRMKVHAVSELILDSIDPPRVMPIIGPVQLHHVHYKCVVRYVQQTQVDGPNGPKTVDEDCKEVIYIDHDHLHYFPVAKPKGAEAPAATKK